MISKKVNKDLDAAQQAEVDNNDAAVSKQELELLDNAGEDEEQAELKNAQLDDTDEDGELLNEGSSAVDNSGDDLDVPGAEEDDDNEALGEEDEENNSYSLSDND